MPGEPWAYVNMVVNGRGYANTVAVVYGYEGVFGLWPAGIFAALFWVFIISGATQGTRWWHPALVLVASAGVVMILLTGAGGTGVDVIRSKKEKDTKDTYFLDVLPKFGGRIRIVMKITDRGFGDTPVVMVVGKGRGPGGSMLAGGHTVMLPGELLRERLQAGGSPDVQVSPGPGLWATGVMALGLFLVGMLQVRGTLEQRRRHGGDVRY
jgi:hypothetical protein